MLEKMIGTMGKRFVQARAIRWNATSTDSRNAPLQEYNKLVKLNRLRNDLHQRAIIKSLGVLYDSLMKYSPPEIKRAHILDQIGWKTTYLGRLISGKAWEERKKAEDWTGIPKGIYLYGDVGCGKTMLMDLFYSTVPPHITKKRVHFHQFMQYVHKRSHEITIEQNLLELGAAKKKTMDPIPFLATEISTSSRLLCFDEFQVTDVADAMILRRLLTILLSRDYGVVLFATSNRKPDDLYINGIQRESFIPCIELIKKRCQVIYLNSPTDYRKIPRPTIPVYYAPSKGLKYNDRLCAVERQHHVNQWYKYFGQMENSENTGEILRSYPLSIWGREFKVPKCSPPNVAQFTFRELCGSPLAAGDYLVLTSTFKAIIITDIPYLSIFLRDEVRRFITFLDAAYNNQIKLATTAAADFTNLFVEPEEIATSYQLKPKTAEQTAQQDEDFAEDDELVRKHGFSKKIAKKSHMFALDEERFAFARALSRLSQMSTAEWVERTD